MKRIITILLAAVLMLSLAACSGNTTPSVNTTTPPSGDDSTTPSSTPTPDITPQESETQELAIGEMVKTDNFEFMLTRVEFAERVTNASFKVGEGASNQQFLLPTTIQVDNSPHRAFDGYIYISYSYNIKYVGTSEISFNVQLPVELLYDSSFLFSVNGNSNGGYSYHGTSATYSLENGNWSSSTDRMLSPFGSNNEFEVRAYIRVPIELVENCDAPLNMKFKLDKNEFTYPITTEQRFAYTEVKANATQDIDEQLQGTWVEEEVVDRLTVSYTFAGGRFTYIYDYKDDAYDKELEGSYAIGDKTITLTYDELTITETLSYYFKDGVLSLTGRTSSNVKVEYIKQD